MSLSNAKLVHNQSDVVSDWKLSLSETEYHQLKDLIFNKFGIFLNETKKGLLVSRLQSLLKEHHFTTFSEYYKYLLQDKDGAALSDLVNRISTNFTFFYREEKHFEFLQKKILPELVQRQAENREMDIRIWCAGCASGEEPYTLMMILKDFLGKDYSQWKAGILATDISEKALNFAQNGIYPVDRLMKLPPMYKKIFFQELPSGEFKIKDEIKKEVTFRRFNLMNEHFPFKKPFHLIFCRNVMIYFTVDTRIQLVDKFCNNLLPKGYLFIGHSETLGREQPLLQYIQPAVYQKKER